MYTLVLVYVHINISINQSINQILKAPHEHKRSHTPPQPHGHTGSKPRDAKRRRLGGLRASRASASLRDSPCVYTLFTEARKKNAEENHLRCIIFLRKKKETRARDLAYYDTLSLSRKSVRADEGTATTLRRCVVLSSAPRDARWPIATHHPVVPSPLFSSVTPFPSSEHKS